MGGFGRHLGLPEHIGRRRRKEVFQFIVQRVKTKPESWYSKLLSPTGKEVLLKSVITVLPTYTMSCFLLQKTLVQEITKPMRKFWWSAFQDKHSIMWIAWNKITASKKDRGLGIRDMIGFQQRFTSKTSLEINYFSFISLS